MRSSPLRRERIGLGFALWGAFCALVGVAWLGLMVWAVIAGIHWLNRH